MKEQEIHEELQALRQTADRTLLRGLDLSPYFKSEVRNRVVHGSTREGTTIGAKVRQSLKLAAAGLVVLVSAFLFVELLHFSNTTQKLEVLSEAAMVSAPAATAAFVQTQANKSEYRFGTSASALLPSVH